MRTNVLRVRTCIRSRLRAFPLNLLTRSMTQRLGTWLWFRSVVLPLQAAVMPLRSYRLRLPRGSSLDLRVPSPRPQLQPSFFSPKAKTGRPASTTADFTYRR